MTDHTELIKELLLMKRYPNVRLASSDAKTLQNAADALEALQEENKELAAFVVEVGGFWGETKSVLIGPESLAAAINQTNESYDRRWYRMDFDLVKSKIDAITAERDQLQAEVEGWRLDQKENLANQCTQHAEILKLRAEVEAVRKANLDCMDNYNQLRQDYDAAQARLKALESQEPVAWMHPALPKAISLADLFEQPQHIQLEWTKGARLFLAAGAAPTKCRTGGTP